MQDPENFEGEELDVEPYEGEPDFPGTLHIGGRQDDEVEEPEVTGVEEESGDA